MVKTLKQLFKNVINKSESDSRLQTDAAVVSSDNLYSGERINDVIETQNQNNERNDSEIDNTNIVERYNTLAISSNASNLNSSLDINNRSQLTPNTAIGEVNNVQNVYNFSNIDGLHIGNSIVINNSSTYSNTNNRLRIPENIRQNSVTQIDLNDAMSSEKNKLNEIKITAEIRNLFKSEENVDEQVLSELSEYVGKNYQRVLRKLGLTQAQIETVELDYNAIGHKEIIFQLLLKWSEEFFEIANYGKLSRNLWRCDCREAVVKLEQILACNKAKNQT